MQLGKARGHRSIAHEQPERHTPHDALRLCSVCRPPLCTVQLPALWADGRINPALGHLADFMHCTLSPSVPPEEQPNTPLFPISNPVNIAHPVNSSPHPTHTRPAGRSLDPRLHAHRNRNRQPYSLAIALHVASPRDPQEQRFYAPEPAGERVGGCNSKWTFCTCSSLF